MTFRKLNYTMDSRKYQEGGEKDGKKRDKNNISLRLQSLQLP